MILCLLICWSIEISLRFAWSEIVEIPCHHREHVVWVISCSAMVIFNLLQDHGKLIAGNAIAVDVVEDE